MKDALIENNRIMNNSIKYRKYIKKLDTPPPSAVSRFSRGDQEAIDH
jgi:hypothetical protein